MKPLLAVLLCVVAGPVAAHPFEPANFNAFLESPVDQPVPGPLSTESTARVQRGVIAHTERRLGVPTFFWSGQPPHTQSLRAMGLTPVEAARRYLLEYGELYRQSGAELAEAAKLSHVHDLGHGAVIVSFFKTVDGVRVFRDELKVIMTQDLELVALSGYLPPHQRIGVRGERNQFNLSDTTALSVALQDLTALPVEPSDLHDTGKVIADYHSYELLPREALRSLHLRQPARTRKVVFTLPEGLEPAYYVELSVVLDTTEGRLSRGYGYVISAVDGRLLFHNDHVAYDAYSYEVWADADGHPWDGPQGNSFSPHPTGQPDGTEPTLGPQTSITLQNGPISTNDPWLPPGATALQGNNVDAYADLGGGDGYDSGDLRPAATTAGVAFDYPFDLGQNPNATSTQIAADVTQMFVDTNFFHDWYYDVGFDEAAGNAQQDNYGRGGVPGDRFLAEGQDFSGTDNANMQTPADGQSPVMQMYIFKGASTQSVTLHNSNGTNSAYTSGTADFGPSSFDVTAELVIAQDGSGTPTDGCSTITNSVAGKIALIDRGQCVFSDKVKNAQNAGAVGVIIANNTSSGAIPLPGSDLSVTIPAVSVSQASGTSLKNAIAPGVTITLFRQSALDRDGTADNAVVAHEWGHYISNRLIGDANGLDNNQGYGMGEGWGDFHSLLIMVREEDSQRAGNATFQGVYGTATFVMTPGNNGLYFGIRRYPYSTDFTKNALTFKHIASGTALPTGVPINPISGASNAEAHNTGEVWATMLWECYASLLADTPRLSFAEAQRRMKEYLVEGYKGTPNSPTFLEARDAILAAAYANDPADFAVLWAAFARRGAGQHAVAPDRYSQTNSPVVEDFTAGDGLILVSTELTDDVTSCDHDGALDNGETGTLKITLRNSGATVLNQTTGTLVAKTPGVTLLGDGELQFPESTPFTTTVATAQVRLDGAKGIIPLEFTLTFADASLAAPAQEPVTLTFRGNVNERPMASTTDDVEAATTLWSPGYNPGYGTPTPWARTEIDPGQHVWFGTDMDRPADVWLTSPRLQVSGSGDFIVSFKHRFDFEADQDGNYDGAVVELRALGGGGSWVDIGSMAQEGGYTGTLVGSPSSNPLRSRDAFVGQSAGYPDFVTTTINLGTAYAGRWVRLRFRIGSDDAAAKKGWEVDDLSFSGIEGMPFTEVTPQVKVCGNHAPVVNAMETTVVDEGEPLQLVASGSDQDGDPLTFTWSQLEGPTVALQTVDSNTASFTAPSVTEDTLLTFQVVANDGKEPSAPAQVGVVVRNVVHPPVAVLEQSGSPVPGQVIAFDGSKSSDADGDPLTFQWNQTAGPKVNLGTTNASGSQASFLVPKVTKQTTFAFSLVVNDGVNDSAPATVEITVQPGANAGGCGCDANPDPGSAPLWLSLLGLGALFAQRRRRAA